MESRERLLRFYDQILEMKGWIARDEQLLLANPDDSDLRARLTTRMHELDSLEEARNQFIGQLTPGSLRLTQAEGARIDALMSEMKASLAELDNR